MFTKERIYMLLAAGLGIGLGVLVMYMLKQRNQKIEAGEKLDYDKLLKKGVKGREVVFLQNFLNSKGAAPKLATDSIFGDKTEAALFVYLNKKETTLKELVAATKTDIAQSLKKEDGLTMA